MWEVHSLSSFANHLSKISRASLGRFSSWLALLFRQSLRHPLWIVLSVVALTTIGALGLPKQRILISFRDIFDADFSSVVNYNQTEELFKTGNSVLLFVLPKDGVWTGRKLCSLNRWILKRQLEEDELDQVRSAFDIRTVQSEPERLLFPKLFTSECESDLPSSALTRGSTTPWGGMLIDKNGRDIGIEFVFRDTPGGSRYGKFDPRPIGPMMKDFDYTLGNELIPIWSGPSMYDYSMRDGMKRMPFLNLGVLVLLLVLCRALLGTWRSGMILSLSLVLTGIMLYGCMAWSGAPVDILTSGLFLMITVSAHQDFSYVSSYRLRNGINFRAAFRRLLIPSFFTSLTTIVGFASLCVSRLSIVSRFGFWAALGSLIEWALIFLFLPSLMTLFPKLQNWTNPNRILIQEKLEGRFWNSFRFSKPVCQAFLVIFLILPFAAPHANFSDDPKGIFEPSHSFRKAMDYLIESRGWEGSVSIVFNTDTDTLFREKITKTITQDPVVAKTESAPEIVSYFREGLEPTRADLVERELRAHRGLDRYEAKSGEARILAYMNTSDLLKTRAFKSRVEALCPNRECVLSGPIDMYSEFIYQVSRTLLESLIVSLAIILLIMSYLILARGVPHGPAIISSSLWGPIAMLMMVILFQIPLNAYTCNFASVLVGLAGDNAIQFIFASRRGRLDRGLENRGSGAFVTSVVMAVCSLVFLGSVFHPPKVLGVLLFAGFLFNFFGDYWILRGLIVKEPAHD